MKKKKLFGFNSFLFIVSFLKKKSMFAEMNSDINCTKSRLIHLMGQPYCKRIDQKKDKDGIITYFLGTTTMLAGKACQGQVL